jgi:hypothetical protein
MTAILAKAFVFMSAATVETEGALVLPTGQLAVMNKNMMQVINPYTGEALAEAPALPDQVKDLVWE